MKFKNYALLLILFFLATFIGSGLSKDSDDEMIYTALAAKISAKGISEYNLRDLSIKNVSNFWKIGNEGNGNLLPSLTRTGATYYDTELFFNPPLWPAVLAASHRLFDGDRDYLLALRRGLAWSPDIRALYSSIPNALIAVFFLAGVFMLAKKFGQNQIYAYLAAGLCLVSPVFLVCVFKVWSDLLAATLILWSFVIYRNKSSYVMVVLAGILFGLALLTRTTSWFAMLIFVQRDWRKTLLIFATAAIISSPWYWAMHHTYGNPIYFPQIDAQARESMQWFSSMNRQWYGFISNFLYLSPFFIFSLASVRKSTGLLWLWVVTWVAVLSFLVGTDRPIAVEDRYLLPIYPALAILAVQGFRWVKEKAGNVLAVSLIAGCMAWSLRAGVMLAASRESLNFVTF